MYLDEQDRYPRLASTAQEWLALARALDYIKFSWDVYGICFQIPKHFKPLPSEWLSIIILGCRVQVASGC